MLRAVRFTDEDFDKPIIALAVPYTNGTPCNDHVRALGDLVQKAIEDAGGKAIVFGTPVVSDGISMGTEAMKYSLVSREVIADSIELMTEGYRVDAVITLSGCDKTIPAALMPIARNNLIGLTLYGGSILPGEYHGRALNIVSAFEAIGAHCAGKIDAEELHAIECHACPGAGSCAGMYTANTMASAIEALGMSLPGAASNLAVDESNQISADKREDCARAAQAVVGLLQSGLSARDIMTRKAFENALTVAWALGGSTNAVLHLLALAHETGVDIDPDRYRGDYQPGAVARRLQALRPIRDERSAQDRRPADGDEDPAGCRLPAWRLPDCDRARPWPKTSLMRHNGQKTRMSSTARTSLMRHPIVISAFCGAISPPRVV